MRPVFYAHRPTLETVLALKHLSNKEFARKIKISYGYWTNTLNGYFPLSAKTRRKMLQALPDVPEKLLWEIVNVES